MANLFKLISFKNKKNLQQVFGLSSLLLFASCSITPLPYTQSNRAFEDQLESVRNYENPCYKGYRTPCSTYQPYSFKSPHNSYHEGESPYDGK